MDAVSFLLVGSADRFPHSQYQLLTLIAFPLIGYVHEGLEEKNMKQKRFLSVLCLFIVSFLIVVGCQPQEAPGEVVDTPTSGQEDVADQPDDASDDAQEVMIPAGELVEPGKLTIATTGNAKPYTLVNDEGGLEGYDIDVCREIAERLGLEPNFVILEWSGILPGLSANRFDMVCTGVGRTEERLASPDFLFSEATVQDGTGLVVRADDDRIQTWDDARGLKMGGVRGAYYSSDVTELLNGDVELVEYPGETELYLDLQNRRIDFATTGYLVAAVRSQEDPNIKLAAEPFHPVTKGIPINKNAPTLHEAVNRLIEEFATSGQLEEWQINWFGVPAMPISD